MPKYLHTETPTEEHQSEQDQSSPKEPQSPSETILNAILNYSKSLKTFNIQGEPHVFCLN